jgi:ATP synthase protein I
LHNESGQESQINWAFFLRLYCIQLIVTLIVSALLGYFKGMHFAQSALMGGMASIIPQIYVGLRIFISERKAQSMHQIVAGFYKAVFYKFILTAMVFFAAFKFVDKVEPLSLILTFILVQSLSWIAPLILKNYWLQK